MQTSINQVDSNGRKQGYWEEGQFAGIRSKGHYIDNKKDGVWVTTFHLLAHKYDDKETHIEFKRHYKNGKFIGLVEFYDFITCKLSQDFYA